MAVGSDPSASGDDCWYRGDGRCGDPCLTAWLIDDEIGPEERQGREAPGATTSGPPAPSRLAGLLQPRRHPQTRPLPMATLPHGHKDHHRYRRATSPAGRAPQDVTRGAG